MKPFKSYLYFLAVMMPALTACTSEDGSAPNYENRIYLSTENFVDEIRIRENEPEAVREISVSLASPMQSDVEIVFSPDVEMLDTYREAYYSPDVELLPARHYGFSSLTTHIQAGKVISEPLELDFIGLDQLDMTRDYVLPVSIVSSSELEPLPRAKTMYYLFRKASLVNVAGDITSNCVWPEWGSFSEVEDMSSFTMEALVNAHEFRNESKISTIMGIEDVFLVRVGDNLIPSNQMQIAYGIYNDGAVTRNSITSPSLKLKTEQWYHIAVTFDRGIVKVYIDGKEKASGNTAALFTKVNFKVPHSDESDGKPRCFWIGYSYDDKRPFNGMVSEVRFWNRALSADDIQQPKHFYEVDPESPGLLAYWKFDDGKGNTVTDHSIYANHLYSAEKLRWMPVELPEGQN